jgi:hypothetical protein
MLQYLASTFEKIESVETLEDFFCKMNRGLRGNVAKLSLVDDQESWDDVETKSDFNVSLYFNIADSLVNVDICLMKNLFGIFESERKKLIRQ